MAKEESKFQLNKGGDHNFDISKGGKRKFDLTKDNDEPVAANDQKVSGISSQKPAETTSAPVKVDKTNRSKKWIWIILAIIIIALLAWWLIPSSDKETNVTPADTEEVSTTPADESASNNDSVEASANAADVVTPVASPESAQPEAPASPEQETQSTESSVSTPVPNSVAISDDIEQEALKVIRGDYGVGQERRNNLGSKYQSIQNRVNEMKREGVF